MPPEPLKQFDHSETDSRQKVLISLLLKHQRAMYAYIFSLVPNRFDADDILQDTCLTIYEKFDEFEIGTDFLPWANRIAYWKVRKARLKFARSKVVFDEKVMEVVSQTALIARQGSDVRHEALASCLKKLNERDRKTILTRYENGGSSEEAARVSNRSIVATYKALTRIRQSLHECVNQEIFRNKKNNLI
ncbi:MAG: sigma-70 family RNA polymerase sigma factor [Verrucomicrobiota bacterium]